MPSILVAGPTEIHFGIGGGLQAPLQFVGWSETGVRVSIRPRFEDVRCDLSGQQVPLDLQYDGQDAICSCDLKLVNASVVALMMNRSAPALQPRGIDVAGSYGGLMFQEGAGIRLLIYGPYNVTKPTQLGQVPPFNFPAAVLLGPDDWAEYGTKAMRIRAVWRAIPAFNPLDGSWILYNNDTTGKPTVLF